MAKFSDPKAYYNEKGRLMVEYVRELSDGTKDIVQEPYYNADGSINYNVQTVLVKLKKEDIIKEQLNKSSNEINNIKTENETTQEKQLPMVVEANKGWFKKAIKKGGFYLTAAVVGIGGVILLTKLDGCGKKEVVEEPAIETVVDTPEEVIDNGVEGAIQYISYEDAIKDMAEIGKAWKDMGFDHVDQRSINAQYFVTNFHLFSKDTVAKFVENGVVADDPMVIIADTLEVSSTCHDQGAKKVGGQEAKLIDMSMFCVDPEDKELVAHAYSELCTMVDSDDKEAVQGYFDDFYHYYRNEETGFPLNYNQAHKGVNLTLKPLSVIACTKAAYEGVDQSSINYLNEHTGMLEFSSVIKELQGCMDQLSGEKTLDSTKAMK